MIAHHKPDRISAPATEPSARPSGQLSPATRRFLWIFSVAMIGITGLAFTFKLIEFFVSFAGDQPLRFAMIPVLTYFIVASGFACLLFWAYLAGQFKDVEAAKHRMLQLQDEIDARESR